MYVQGVRFLVGLSGVVLGVLFRGAGQMAEFFGKTSGADLRAACVARPLRVILRPTVFRALALVRGILEGTWVNLGNWRVVSDRGRQVGEEKGQKVWNI